MARPFALVVDEVREPDRVAFAIVPIDAFSGAIVAHGVRVEIVDLPALRPIRSLFPLPEARKKHALAAFWLRQSLAHERCPTPTQPKQGGVRSPGAFPLGPVWIGQSRQ